MGSLSYLWVCFIGVLVTFRAAAGNDDVLCFSEINEETGECDDFLGDGVSEADCCLNINYAFKQDIASSCVSCRPAAWSEWSAWSACTVSCKEGVQQRRRLCIGQGDCEGAAVEVQSCVIQDCCPVVGGWSDWSLWSQCSVTCASGQQQRTRECNNPPPSCGAGCAGVSIMTTACNTGRICPTHGNWGSWDSWGACTSACIVEHSGVFPVQSRNRLCNNPPPSANPPGNPCRGSPEESRDCTSLPFCPVDGQWGPWVGDSECTVTCGVGRIKQKRTCNNPAPRYGGKGCVGASTRSSICNTKVTCPVDGQWTEWQPWVQCNRLQEKISCTPKVGTQHRLRQCQGVTAGGKWCEGNYRESRYCYEIEECRLPGSWTEWSAWGLCSAPCGRSERTRFRECTPIYPEYPSLVEITTKIVEVIFSGTPKPNCAAIDGEKLRVEEKMECQNLPAC